MDAKLKKNIEQFFDSIPYSTIQTNKLKRTVKKKAKKTKK
jgi:hypothetical protein